MNSPCESCIWQTSNPLWAWAKQTIATVALLTLILRLSASNFDETELFVIGAFASALGFDKFADVKGWKATVNNWIKGLFKAKE